MSLPPGPSSPALAQSLEWAFRPESLMARCQRRYGDVFTLRMLGWGSTGTNPVVFVSDPGAVKAIFTGDPELVPVGASRRMLTPMFGPASVLIVDGAQHLRQRRLMLPPFHGERMSRYGELIERITDDELDRWPLGRPFPLQPRMQAITLEVILRAVFGVDVAHRDDLRDRIVALLAEVSNPLAEIGIALPRKIGPVNIRAKFERLLARTDEALLAQIRRRRADPELAEREDILSMLLQARDEDGNPMTDSELRDQLVTLLLAGHETTATGLAWAFDHLHHRPEALERLVEECRDGEDASYLNAVITETLRLRPPVPMTDRTLAGPFELNGHVLPAGTVLGPCIHLLHRRADLYPEPDAFKPERFLEQSPETYSWIPFGGGVRRCLGASFATFEMKVVLRTVLRRARLGAASSRPEGSRRRSIVLAPARGARSVLVERRPKPPEPAAWQTAVAAGAGR
jgi:cytochrome P450